MEKLLDKNHNDVNYKQLHNHYQYLYVLFDLIPERNSYSFDDDNYNMNILSIQVIEVIKFLSKHNYEFINITYIRITNLNQWMIRSNNTNNINVFIKLEELKLLDNVKYINICDKLIKNELKMNYQKKKLII